MRKLLSILLLAAAIPAAAQGQWSLEDCIRHALEHNLTVRQGELSVDQGEIDVNTAENSRLPGLSAGASQNFSFGRGLTADNTYDNSNTTSTGFSLGADVNIFNGFQKKHNIAMSRLNLAAATADLEKAKDDIRVAVAQAYVQILYNEEILEVAEHQIVIDSLQAERLAEMLRGGKASEAEVAQQEASLAQSRYQRTQAENNLRLAVLDLTQLLELPSPEGFAIERPASEALEPRLLEKAEDIYAYAVGTRPSVIAEERRLDAAASRIAVAKSAFSPSLSLSGGVGTNYYTSSGMPSANFGTQIENNFSQYVGLSLNIPIFSRFSTRNSVRSAQIGFNAQQLQLENTRKALFKEIQQAYYNAVASQERFASSRQVLASTEKSFELVSAKYEAGKANVTEFNEARNNLVRAESDLVQARYEQLFQTALLNFYKGGGIRL